MGRQQWQGRTEWGSFLTRFPLDTFFTCTFSDEYAVEHHVYSATSALNNFERFLRDAGVPGQYFVAAESHYCRDVPHLHGLLESRGLPLRNLWGAWFVTRGRSRFEPPRSDAARIYCTKYAVKDINADSLRFRLGEPARVESDTDGRHWRYSASGVRRPK